MTVNITDEFHTVWSFETDSVQEVVKIVQEWLQTRDSTPIYEITILV